MNRDALISHIKSRMAELGLNQHSLALKAGVHQDAVRDFFRGKTRIFRADIHEKIMAVLDAGSPATISKAQVETVYIPVYDVAASAGAGLVIHEENVKYHATFRLEWLKRVSSAPLNKLAIISVEGDSMQPTLSPEDTVLVDMTQTQPRRDGIYVLRYDDAVLVKRLRYDPQRRMVTILSDNPAYPPLDITDLDCLHVIGRVLWLGRRV